MKSHDERRKFPRLTVEEQAVALGPGGEALGNVTGASGGGLQIEQMTAAAIGLLQPGKVVEITVHEPATDVRSVVRAQVRYVHGSTAGLEFASPSR